MTYSPLVDRKAPPTGRYKGGKKWSARPSGVRINGLNVHHWASTSMAGYDRLIRSSDPASANYLILDNGELIGSVPEEYRAWTTSSYANDDDKITVEIQNSTGGPSWRISDAAMRTLIRLYADIANRHGFTPNRAHIKGHQEYGVATACPGPYLLPRLDWVAEQAQEEDDVALSDDDLDRIAKAVWKKNLFTLNGNEAKAVASASEGDTRSAGALIQRTLVLAHMARIRDLDVEVDAKTIADLIPDSLAKDVADELANRLKG